jgi:hypothetical protein
VEGGEGGECYVKWMMSVRRCNQDTQESFNDTVAIFLEHGGGTVAAESS